MSAADVEYDPLLLPDAGAAVVRLGHAISAGERIAVYGDFDVDGVTSSAILIDGLRALGGDAVSYIPDRFTEGYGVNIAAIDRLHAQGVRLIVTADCGTGSLAEIAHAKELGIATIVVDHHTVPPQLPDAVAVINPKRPDNRYPDSELATGGLAFKLIAALSSALGRRFEPERYLDLVALSTVCDVAPLRDENRTLVRRGLAVFSRTTRPGLRALMEASGVDPERADTESIGYSLGPRLNAAGRLSHARLSLDLLMETDDARAMQRALELTQLNQQRQQATAAAVALAKDLLAAEDPDAPLIFIGHQDIPPGIVGIVAGRLAEEYYRPAVVYQRGETTSRASCRSIPEYHITDALRSVPGLMLRFGGHRAAAGFTAQNASLPALKQALTRHAADALRGMDLAPALDIDAAIPLARVNGELIRYFSMMRPFGEGNPEPAFLSRGVEIRDCRVIGSDGTHLRLSLRDGRTTWPAIAFGQAGEGCAQFAEGDRIDVVYTFGSDGSGNGGLEMRIKDLRHSALDMRQEDV
jgi:single-stranded-DNA-specific exonuclease